MKLLLDEHISDKVADRLRELGHDVIAVTAEPSLIGLADPKLFESAQQIQRTVVTYNRSDFESIAFEYSAAGEEHHGLVIVHPQRFPSAQFNRLVKALDKLVLPPGGSFVLWLQP